MCIIRISQVIRNSQSVFWLVILSSKICFMRSLLPGSRIKSSCPCQRVLWTCRRNIHSICNDAVPRDIFWSSNSPMYCTWMNDLWRLKSSPKDPLHINLLQFRNSVWLNWIISEDCSQSKTRHSTPPWWYQVVPEVWCKWHVLQTTDKLHSFQKFLQCLHRETSGQLRA